MGGISEADRQHRLFGSNLKENIAMFLMLQKCFNKIFMAIVSFVQVAGIKCSTQTQCTRYQPFLHPEIFIC